MNEQGKMWRLGFALTATAALALVLSASTRLRGLLENTALLAEGTIVLALPIGVLLGTVIAKIDLPGRRVLTWLIVGWLFVPLYVQAAALNAMLGSGGLLPQTFAGSGYAWSWFTGWPAAIVMHAVGAVPWAALFTAASLRAVERRFEEESLLDASPPRVILRVSLRRALGGVLAAAVWIAVICSTEIAVTDLFQLRTFAEEIYTQATLGSLSGSSTELLHSDLAIGIALIALLVGLALTLILPWLPVAATAPADANWKWRPVRGRVLGATIVWLVAAAILLLPMIGLVWKTGIAVQQIGEGYSRSWSIEKAAAMVVRSPWDQRREWAWSAAIGVSAALAAAVIGILLAWLARVRRGAVPPLTAKIVIGLAIPAPLWGVWVIKLLSHSHDSVFAPLTVLYDRTLAAPILVQTIRALPLVSLWLWSQFSSIPRDLVEAARSEGAGAFSQLMRVALPLRLPAVATAALAGLLIAFGEVSATLLVVPPGVTTISVRVFQLIHYGIDDRVAAVCLSIFGVLGLLIAVAAWLSCFYGAAESVRMNETKGAPRLPGAEE
jgi:iron(III) transport system permease protein